MYFFARLFWPLFVPVIFGSIAWGMFYVDSTAYLYPHEEAKVYFDNFHEEGYESIESVTYIGRPHNPLRMAPKIRGVVAGQKVSSEHRGYDLAKIKDAFGLSLFNCPEGLSAKRSDAGWVYEVTPEIKDTKHRKSIEACIGMTVAGVYEAKKLLDVIDADEIKEAKERKESWETAPRPE